MPPSQNNPAPARASLSRWLSRFAIGLVVVLVLIRMALPAVLRSQIESRGSEALGASLAVENVDISLLVGEISIQGISLGSLANQKSAAANNEDLLQLDELRVRIRLVPTLAGTITLDEVGITAPRIRLQRLEDGRLDAALLGPTSGVEEAATDKEDTGAEDSEPLRVVVRSLSVRALDLELRDATSENAVEVALAIDRFNISKFSLEGDAISIGSVALEAARIERIAEPPLAITVEADAANITNTPENSFAVSLSAVLDHYDSQDLAPRVALEGDITLVPPGFDGRIEYKGLPIPQLAHSFDVGPVADWLHSGEIAGTLAVQLKTNAEAVQDVHFAGKFIVNDFHLTNSLEEESKELEVAWKTLTFDLREASLRLGPDGTPLSPPNVRVSEISLLEPRGRYTQPADALAALSTPQDTVPEATEPEPAGDSPPAPSVDPAAPQLRIDYVEIKNGSFELVDRSTSPTFHDRLHNIQLEASGIEPSLQRVEKIDFRLNAEDATLAIKGAVGKNKQINVQLDDLDLAPFNAYVMTHAGYVIEKGELSLHSVIDQKETLIGTQSEFTLKDLDIEEAEAGGFREQFGVSLSTGLALLRDVDGNIVLPVTLETSEDQTALKLGPILFNAFRSTLLGAITSPLKLLYSVVPGEDAQASALVIECEPATHAFAERSDEQISALARLLATRPNLAVTIRGQVGPEDNQSDPRLNAEGKLDALARARSQALQSLLSKEDGISLERLRVDPQIVVGSPGVVVEVDAVAADVVATDVVAP